MAERRIADVMHQAGHFHHALKRSGEFIQPVGFQQTLLFQATEDLFGDIASHLLNFKGVG